LYSCFSRPALNARWRGVFHWLESPSPVSEVEPLPHEVPLSFVIPFFFLLNHRSLLFRSRSTWSNTLGSPPPPFLRNDCSSPPPLNTWFFFDLCVPSTDLPVPFCSVITLDFPSFFLHIPIIDASHSITNHFFPALV